VKNLTDMVFIDGNMPMHPNRPQWVVKDSKGNVLCEFKGPMSFIAACAFTEGLNGETYGMSEAMHTYEQYRIEVPDYKDDDD
jgi:hypothetical protein